MTLSEFVKTFPRLQRAELRKWIASELGISESYVRIMCYGGKPIPAKHAIRIEKITNGLVPRQITAPQFYPIEE